VIRRMQIAKLSCTRHRDGTVEVDVRGPGGLQALQLELGPRQWKDLAENVVLFGAFDVDLPRVRARLGDLRKAVQEGRARAVLTELESLAELLEPGGPREGHWFGCTLPADHEGDCVVRRSR
jgi:hypothetical protein